MTRALLTGASGFIGAAVAGHFTTLGWNVAALLRVSSNPEKLDAATNGKCKVYLSTGTLANLEVTLQQFNPDVVVHIASKFVGEHKAEDIDALIESNIAFPTRLVEAMVHTGHMAMVNTGTAWQRYGEGVDTRPLNLYAATKESFEVILKTFANAGGRAITLELYDTYGPQDKRKKIVSLLKSHAEVGETLRLSPGYQYVDLVHVNDVVEAYQAAVESIGNSAATATYVKHSVDSGCPITLRELVAIYQEATAKKLDIQWGVTPYRKNEVMRPITPLPRITGWAPRIDLREGLRSL